MASSTQAAKAPKGTKSQKLEDQAATAALYVTGNKKGSKATYPLDADNKLSSASAATSLKYAKPADLPSFPIVGINQESSAGAAASLAAANQKSFEHWKPEYSHPANKAAFLAKDYKAAPLWQPEASSAGSKAAYLAATNSTGVNIWRPDATPEGNSAAGQAMRSKSLSPEVDYGYTKDGSSRALLAATGAMSGKKRPVSAEASEPLYPDAENSAANALKAATKAHKPAPQAAPAVTDLPGLSQADAVRIHKAAVTNMNRQMYTSNPPVAPEVEERNREAGLRAAAITMANAMYDSQEKAKHNRSALQAATSVHNRPGEEVTADKSNPVAAYINLQETAKRLAEERLAKLHDESAEYRKHYGIGSQPKSRLSVRGHRRSSTGSDDTDQAQSRRIRSEMSGLNKQLAEVDEKKRQKDRNALLEAARRNVTKNMNNMDEKVFQQTGKASPAMQAEWDAKARARAEAESNARMANHGKIAIGGGRYMDQSEIDAIAAGRVQPTLDEVTQVAEEKRAADEARRQKIEDEKRIKEEKVADDRERNEKTKSEWRRFKAEEKDEAKAKKEAEKANKAEQKEAEKRMREEQLKALNEQDIQRPSDKDKRRSGLGAFTSTLKGRRKSTTEKGTATTSTENRAGESRRSSTSLESSSDEEGAAIAAHSADLKGKSKEEEPDTSTTTDTAKATDLPKHEDSVNKRIAVALAPTTETTITASNKSEETSPKESGKKSSWFKRLSRRASKPVKPEEAASSSAKPESTDSTIVKEPITGLPMDTSKENSGFGTDHIPHIEPKNPEPEDQVEASDAGPTVQPATSATSATINPAVDSAISPAEVDATNAKEEFDESSQSGGHMPTSLSAVPGEFLPLHLQPSVEPNTSERDVALAGKTDAPPRSRSTSLSSMSSDAPAGDDRGRVSELSKRDTSDSRGEEFQEAQEAQDTLNTEDLPMPAFQKQRVSGDSPHRETRFREELEGWWK